jgi:hypothetical protein
MGLCSCARSNDRHFSCRIQRDRINSSAAQQKHEAQRDSGDTFRAALTILDVFF